MTAQTLTLAAVLAVYNAKAAAAGHPPLGRSADWRETISQAIVNRDAPALKVLANGCNPTGLAVLFEVAGLGKPPRTQRDQWAAIKAWCGYSPEAEATAEAEAKAARDANAAARDLDWTGRAADAFRVRDGSDTLTGREWLDRRISEGFTLLTNAKRGAVAVYDLRRPGDAVFYRLTSRNWAPVAALARAYAAAGKLSTPETLKDAA